MTVIRNKSFIKVIAICVAVLFVFQGEYIFAIQQVQQDQQVTEEGQKEADPLVVAYEKGKKQYFDGDFEGARATFEPLLTQLAEVEGRDILKGETYLLLGATYEALKYKDPAIKYYCLAKKLLGKGKTVDPLELKELKYYKKKCPSGVVGYAGKRKKKGLGVLGTLLGLALLAGAGYLLYKYVIKKDDDDGSKSMTESEAFYNYKFETVWSLNIKATCGAVGCSVSYSPESYWNPDPQPSNNFDNTSTLTFSGNGTIKSVSIKLTVKLWGCNGGTRKDTFYINGNKVQEVTNTFNDSCDTPTNQRNYKEYELHSQGSLKDITMRHVIEIQGLTGVKVISKSYTIR